MSPSHTLEEPPTLVPGMSCLFSLVNLMNRYSVCVCVCFRDFRFILLRLLSVLGLITNLSLMVYTAPEPWFGIDLEVR